MFSWERANSMMSRAKTADDYAAAAEVYGSMVADGIENPHLYSNYGTALLLAERPQMALCAYQKAEALGGTSTDLRHNTQLALVAIEKVRGGAEGVDPGSVQLSWLRVPMFWHYGMPLRLRVIIAAACFNLIFLALAISAGRGAGKNGGSRNFGAAIRKPVLAIAIVGLILFVSSILVSAHHLSRPIAPPPAQGEQNSQG